MKCITFVIAATAAIAAAAVAETSAGCPAAAGAAFRDAVSSGDRARALSTVPRPHVTGPNAGAIRLKLNSFLKKGAMAYPKHRACEDMSLDELVSETLSDEEGVNKGKEMKGWTRDSRAVRPGLDRPQALVPLQQRAPGLLPCQRRAAPLNAPPSPSAPHQARRASAPGNEKRHVPSDLHELGASPHE